MMFRYVARTAQLLRAASAGRTAAVAAPVSSSSRRYLSDAPKISPAEFDAKYIGIFNSSSSDGWDVRKAMQDLHEEDLVPEPEVVIAALRACRRINDYGLAVRFLEAIEFKCGPEKDKIWPWMVQQIKPTLSELGISSVEEMGYDKPEFYPKPEQGVFD